MKRTNTALVVVLVLGAAGTLTGCTSEAGRDDAPGSTTSASPDAVLPGSTQAQWANVMAAGRSGVKRAYRSWEDWDCQPTTIDSTCAQVLSSMAFSADALATSIQDRMTVGDDWYLGDPPPELADLVPQAQAAATALAQTATTASTTCETGEATCSSDVALALAAHDAFTTQLAAWDPYGGGMG